MFGELATVCHGCFPSCNHASVSETRALRGETTRILFFVATGVPGARESQGQFWGGNLRQLDISDSSVLLQCASTEDVSTP